MDLVDAAPRFRREARMFGELRWNRDVLRTVVEELATVAAREHAGRDAAAA